MVQEHHFGRDVDNQVPAVADVFEVLDTGLRKAPSGKDPRHIRRIAAVPGREAKLGDDRLGLSEVSRQCGPLLMAGSQDHGRDPRANPSARILSSISSTGSRGTLPLTVPAVITTCP